MTTSGTDGFLESSGPDETKAKEERKWPSKAELKGFLAVLVFSTCKGCPRKPKSSKGEEIVSVLRLR